MAAFSNSKYEDDSGEIHPIRLRPETLAAAGAPPTGAITSNIRAQITKTNREFGLRPRMVTLARTEGTGDDAQRITAKIPVLTATAFAGAAFAIDADITYDGQTWKVVSKLPEDY